MTTISIQCVHCHKRYNAPATMAGKKVKCKHCGKVFAIPAEAAAQDEAEAGLSAMGTEAQDTGAPVATGAAASTGSRAGGGTRAGGGKLGSASAGYAARMARNENATEIEFADDRPAYSLRPSVPYAFPGAAAIENALPPILILLSLGWLGWMAYVSANDTGVAWAGILRAVTYVLLCLGLAFPLGYWAVKHASRKMRFMLPPKPGTRALGAFSFAFAIALVTWLAGQSIGMLVTGTILGLIVALGAVWFLFRLQPREMGTALGGSAAAFIGSVVLAYLVLFGVNTVFAVALTKSGTNPFVNSPMGPIAWNVPKVDTEPKLKPKTHVPLVIAASQPTDGTVIENYSPNTGTTRPTTQTAAQADPGAAVAMLPDGKKPEVTTPKPPEPPVGTNPGSTEAPAKPEPNPAEQTKPKPKPLTVESPLVAKVTPVAELTSGSQLFFPPSGASVLGALARNAAGDEVVELFTGNPPAKAKVQPEPFAVEKKVIQNYALSNNGDMMARLTSFPQVGVQLVGTATGKEIRTLALDATGANGQPYLVGFGVNDWVIILWERPGSQQTIEVINPKAAAGTPRTGFVVDQFEVTPSNPIISPDGKQLAVATFVNNEGGIDLYDLTARDPKRKPVRTLKVGLPKWTKPSGMAYGPGGTLAAYFELEGDGVLYHFQTTSPNPLHTHTFRGSRALTPQPPAQGGGQNAPVFAGRTLEFLSPNEWLVFGRHLIDVETGKSIGELGVPAAKAQRVVDKETVLIQSCDAGGGQEQLVQLKLKSDEIVSKRNELRGGKPLNK